MWDIDLKGNKLKKRLIGQLFLSYMLVILISLILSIWYASNAFRQFYLNQVEIDLKARAFLVESQLHNSLLAKNTEYINKVCKELDQKASMRITVILPSGEVIGDSKEAPALMDNHKDRPEVVAALSGNIGNSIRYSNTLKKDMMYVAIPVISNDEIIGVVRTAIPLVFVDQILRIIYNKIIIEGVLVALIAASISFFMSRRISKPLEELEKGVKKFAAGDLKYKLTLPKTKEIAELAQAMNDMAIQLDNKITQIEQQNKEQDIILSSMVEGVIAIDMDGKIIKLNKVAAKLIKADISEIQGCKINEVIRNSELHKFIAKTLLDNNPAEEDIILYNYEEERFLKAYCSVLQDIEGRNIGALIVLNDITKIRKLENIRRDFIANVSHELRTPITSIKGYAETLIDGAINDPEDAKRFINIILNHTDRLNNIIQDLLSLSRLEQESGEWELDLEKVNINDVLKSAVQVCTMKAESRNIKLEFYCPESIHSIINSSLMEQAVVNLIDNAIKYSESGSKVIIDALKVNDEFIIKVIDQGCGISKEHLSRIFERFYRVDKARSRKIGGTGLGLAIVKHISQAHGGYTKVESTPGEGSTFSIHFPIVLER